MSRRKQKVENKITQSEFIAYLIKEFPAIELEVLDEDYAGLLSLQLGCLTRYVNCAIENSRLDEVSRAFKFFESAVDRTDDKVNNALFIAFLEHLKLESVSENAKQARKFLAPRYLRIWEQLRRNSV